MKKKNLLFGLASVGILIAGVGYFIFNKREEKSLPPLPSKEVIPEEELEKGSKESPKKEQKKKKKEYEDVEDLTIDLVKLVLTNKDCRGLGRQGFCDLILRSLATEVPDYDWLLEAPTSVQDLEALIEKYGLKKDYETYLLKN